VPPLEAEVGDLLAKSTNLGAVTSDRERRRRPRMQRLCTAKEGTASLTATYSGSQSTIVFMIHPNSIGASALVYMSDAPLTGPVPVWVPSTTQVKAGWTVQFNPLINHDVVFDPIPGAPADIALGTNDGGRILRVFSRPGSFPYHCTIHGEAGVVHGAEGGARTHSRVPERLQTAREQTGNEIIPCRDAPERAGRKHLARLLDGRVRARLRSLHPDRRKRKTANLCRYGRDALTDFVLAIQRQRGPYPSYPRDFHHKRAPSPRSCHWCSALRRPGG
jgi:plastocyanin